MSAMPHRFRYLLLASLALNLLLGATLIATHWHSVQSQSHGGDRRWARVPDPRALAHALGEADRKILLEVIERHRDGLSAHFRPLGAARRELAEALRAEPFDPANMEAAFLHMRGAEGGTADAMHAFMIDLAPKISAAGRARIAEHLERGHRHPRQDARPPAPPDTGG